jgi:hypothetical protein
MAAVCAPVSAVPAQLSADCARVPAPVCGGRATALTTPVFSLLSLLSFFCEHKHSVQETCKNVS